MSLAIIYPGHDARAWISALKELAPQLQVEVWPEIENDSAVEFVLCWNQPPGSLQSFANLKGISSLGAGVNHLLNDASRPAGVPIARLVDSDLQQSMAEYVLLGALDHIRQFSVYQQQQLCRTWQPLESIRSSDIGLGIMGIGSIGAYVGRKLQDVGFRVHGWCRTPKQLDGIDVFCGGAAFGEFLGKADILVCLLPLTAETAGILNARTFAQLPPAAYLINVARGRHLVEQDLLAALAAGRLAGALLDVFSEEPLPVQHPFWTHAKIRLTPHVASRTNPRSAASQVIDNYQRALAGRPLLNQVDPERGY